MVIIKVYW